MARRFACRCGLLAFAATTVDGWGMGADATTVLGTALVRLGVFYGLGLVCGDLARRLVDEAVERDWKSMLAAADQTSA